MNHITTVSTVAVPVTDQDRAVEFYVGTLGFDKHLDAPLPQLGGRWIVVGPAGSSTTLALLPASDDIPAGRDTGIRFGTADAAAAHRDLAGHGVDVGEVLSWPGVPPMFTFRDPDGNTLYLVEG
jgi:catechol 2,3-dioxygenase-like lactoylglutathione lyase family enzyme